MFFNFAKKIADAKDHLIFLAKNRAKVLPSFNRQIKTLVRTITGIMLQLLSLLHAKAIDENGECREEKREGKLGGYLPTSGLENKKTFEGSSKAIQNYVNASQGKGTSPSPILADQLFLKLSHQSPKKEPKYYSSQPALNALWNLVFDAREQIDKRSRH